MKVHDAGPQGVAASNHRIRNEDLATPLQPVEHLPVDRVELLFCLGLSQARPQGRGHISEHGDAEILTEQIQVGVPIDSARQRL